MADASHGAPPVLKRSCRAQPTADLAALGAGSGGINYSTQLIANRPLAKKNGLRFFCDDRSAVEPFASNAPTLSCSRLLVDVEKPTLQVCELVEVLALAL